jgi:hypothetical protein
MLRGRIIQAVITGSPERLQIRGYDEDRRVFIGADWTAQPSIQDEFLLQLLSTAETKELRELLAGNSVELPKGHIPIREIKTIRERFKITANIEWSFTVVRKTRATMRVTASPRKTRPPRS